MNNIYVVTFGWDNDEIGYFKSEAEAKEYCELMNKNGYNYGGYCYQEFKLLDLEEEKRKIKYFFNTRLVLNTDDDILNWNIRDMKANSTTDNDYLNEYTCFKVNDNNYEISLIIESSDKREAIKGIRTVMGEIQDKYYDCMSLETALKEVLR